MSAKKRRLDQLQIVSPCKTDWDRMSGDEKKRFCSECDKFVYDFSQMTRRQVEAIVSIHQGRLCARITRRPDGSLLTLEPPHGDLVAARRASPLANATLAAILGLSVPANALNVDASAAQLVIRSDADRDGAGTPYGGGEGLISGTVFNQQVAAIPNAVVKLISDAGAELKTTTSTDGEFAFKQVPYGSYIMLVEAQGFYTHVNSNVVVDTPYDMRFDVTMKAKRLIALSGAVAIGDGRPSSLLDLYRQSDLVAIAQVERSTVVGTEEGAIQLRTTLRVSSQFKGENNQQLIPFYHWVRNGDKNALKPGDRLLVFLRRRESEDGSRLDGYEESGWQDSIRELDDSALAIYRQRIEELAAIYRRGAPDPAEIVEWLTRLVEEPATRETGALKLSESLSLLASQRDQENEAASQSVESDEAADEDEGENSEEDSTGRSPDDEVVERDREDVKIAEALTQEHKARLANVLFGIAELKKADMALVSVVEEFGDERLAPYLVSQLRRVGGDAPEFAVSLIQTIARLVKDADLDQLVDDEWAADRSSIFYRIDSDDEPPQQDSIRDRRAEILNAAAEKRRAIIKDFLKLVEYKTRL